MRSLLAGVDKYAVFFMAALITAFLPGESFSLTVDDAMALARESLPSYKASKVRVRSREALYKASLGPYLPSLDAFASQEHHNTRLQNVDLNTANMALSYTLFDGGRRKATRNNAKLSLEIDRQELATNLLQLQFDVKSAFYGVMARKEILDEREVQLQDAKKDYEVAQGRHEFGVARLSDVLQASVRLEQAKFNLVQAEGDFKKTLSELNSLLGRPLGSEYDLQGSLNLEIDMPDPERLSLAAMQRPEIKQVRLSIEISKNNKAFETGAFFPVLSASASYTRTETTGLAASTTEDRAIGITATWNIFELGKFYRTRSADFEINVSEENLNEAVRLLLLDIRRVYEDFLTASKNVVVAGEQLKQAEHNYSQAFGEYRVGKSDILSLVQAESALAVAREQLIISKLNLMLSKALLERATGVEKLESLDQA